MSAFATGLTPGMTVMRGDIIGYVGDTGSTTGPHLHYEVLRNGNYVDPMRVAMPSGRDLSGDPAIFAAFEAERNSLDNFRTGEAFRLMADAQRGAAAGPRSVAP
jgi:murein DD-endopeptidase MepM/ murein hydrolase activator NlpD